MSNLRLALIIITAFVLMLIFGRSPMDEVRKKRAERAGQKLVEKIEDASKKGNLGVRTMGPLNGNFVNGQINNNYVQGGYPQPQYQQPQYQQKQPVQPGYPQTSGESYNNGPNPFANPYVKTPSMAVQGKMPQGIPRDGYYPPAPVYKGPNAGPQSSLQKFGPNRIVSNPNFTTDAGQSVAFFGTKVYTFDENGQPKPMPDGKYPMYDGKWTMMVRGGEQTIANGDTGSWAF